MTIAQGIILDDNAEAFKVIEASLQDQGMELALDWITEERGKESSG